MNITKPSFFAGIAVACAAVIMPLEEGKIIAGINDSKKVPEKKREELYEKIIETALAWKVVFIGHIEIDRINILNAAKLGMKTAVDSLSVKPDIVLIDAVKLDLECETLPLIHGDALSYSIAAASILAKVERDRLMREYDREYPQYGFAKHKGYGTAQHCAMIRQFGKCAIHRDSFIKKIVGEGGN